MNRKEKQQRAREVAQKSSQYKMGEEFLEELAMLIVDPISKNRKAMVFPAIEPGYSGCALFPFETEISGQSDFNVIMSPSMSKPIQISHLAGIVPENANTHLGDGEIVTSSSNNIKSLTMSQNDSCSVEAIVLGGIPALPLSSAAGATVTFQFTTQVANITVKIDVLAWNGAAWAVVGTTPNSIGNGTNSDATLAGVVWDPSYTHVSFRRVPGSQIGYLGFGWSYKPTVGTLSCAGAAYDPLVMDTFFPAWGPLIENSRRISVVAICGMLTFTGSTLQDEGQIAVCNAPDDLVFAQGAYQTIASRPRDVYTGRLSSRGGTEGGAHWHWLPSRLEDRTVRAAQEQADWPDNGYFAVAGMDAATGRVKLRAAYVVNFYSDNPEYNMTIQPPGNPLWQLDYLLRIHVPLVSSNDGHLQTVVKAAKKAVREALKHPELLQTAASLLAKLLPLLL